MWKYEVTTDTRNGVDYEYPSERSGLKTLYQVYGQITLEIDSLLAIAIF